MRRDRQEHGGELPAAVGSLPPPKNVRCSRIHFSLHLTCPREGQGQVSDPVCTESCECLFWNDNWSERAGNSRASKITPPRSQGGAHRDKVQLPLPAHLGTMSPFPSDLVLGFQSECGERSALGCRVPKEDRPLRCLMVWAVVLVELGFCRPSLTQHRPEPSHGPGPASGAEFHLGECRQALLPWGICSSRRQTINKEISQ